MKTTVLDLFATPVIETQFDAHRKYEAEFGNWEKRDRKPEQWHVPLNTSFPDVGPDDPYVSPDVVDSLKKDIMFQVKKVMLSNKMPTDLEYTSFWYNAYFAKNCFPGTFYFVRTEYSHRTQQSFNHQNTPLRQYYEEFYPTPYCDGHLILFPPHLHHSVKVGAPNKSDQRLTFSFNLSHTNETYSRDT